LTTFKQVTNTEALLAQSPKERSTNLMTAQLGHGQLTEES